MSDSGSARAHYALATKDQDRFLSSATAPNVKLHVDRQLAVSAGSRKRFPRQSVFLDGAYSDAPFLDNEARQYSLDHHAGCVRAFTLATCEQAVVMLLQGLPLDEGEWHLYINEPDLDAVLAAWVLMNHAELLRGDRSLLVKAMPIIRVEGVIDAHGLEKVVLAGLPHAVFEETRKHIEALLAEERSLKLAGQWASLDVLAYTQRALDAIDRLLFPEGHLAELLASELVEIARAPIQGQKFALLCRSGRGVYAVESELRRRHEKQLALFILDQGAGRFTLRQVDPFLTRTLEQLYKALNREDPKVRPDNRWGGSGDIGGSPRATGSALTGENILALIAEEYAERGLGRRAWMLLRRAIKRWRASRAAAPVPRDRALVPVSAGAGWWRRILALFGRKGAG